MTIDMLAWPTRFSKTRRERPGTALKPRACSAPKTKVLEHFQRDFGRRNLPRKYIACRTPQISGFNVPVPFPRGAYRDRHERGAELRWTRSAVRNPLRGRAALLADGEVMWSWRSDAGAK
jgi:hypothetical protein